MKNLIKFINVIIFSVFIIQGLLFADQNASKDGIVHPGGLGVVNVKSKDGRQRGNVESQWWLNEENLTEYTDVKNWMLDEGLEFNGTNLTDLTFGIHRCVNKMWRDALLGFKSCETLKNHRGGKTYKELFDGIEDKNKQKRILFNPSVSPGAAAQLDASGDNIELPIGDLEGIVRYYAQKMISGDFNIKDFSDPKGDASSKHFFEQTGYLGHEMLHAFTGLSAAVYPGDSKTALAIKTECMVHCLQKCIDPSHRQMVNECNGKDTDTFCEIGDTCEFEECFKKFPPMAYNWGGNISFGNAFNDTPDDNYSHSAGIYSLYGLLSSTLAFPLSADQEFFSYSYYPDVLIYDKFNYPDLPGLLDNYEGTGNIDDYDHSSFSNNHRLLIIPSGEFMGDENSSIIKEALKQFVETGGTLLVLSQQYDTHIENLVPVPEGENIDFVGWRQDQSCYHGSVYFKGMHPVLSSSTGELLSGAVDGYFEAWPSTSTVLLNRSKNREAAMLYYPYGNGTVILTSLYTDWGYAHSQATLMELRVVRDLITFAKNPQLPIPMYDLTENFYPVIDLNVKVKNSAETPAAKVILKAYTPDRKRVLHQVEQALTLAPGEEVEIPVQFTLPGLGHTEYGIGHVDYELYDSENNLVQIPTESDSGRFAVHNMTRPYTPTGGMDMWLTVEDEEVPHYEIPEFTLHIKNYTDTDQTVDFNYECNHRGSHPLFSVTVPANGRIDRPIIIENEEPFQRLWLYSNTGKVISKGVNIIKKNANLQKSQYMVYLDFLTIMNSDV